MSMKELEGKTVLEVYIGDTEDCAVDVLVFITDQGTFVYYTAGDCCSISWFNDMLGVGNLLNFTVVSVEDVELPEPQQKDYEYLQDYGIKLTTTGGYVDIVYRNESNGYYGGWCELYDGDGYQNLRKIETDWSADE